MMPTLNYETDMKSAKDFQPLIKRRKDLSKRRADLEQELAEVARLESELAITERTVAEGYGVTAGGGGDPGASRSARGKPKDLPSIHDMTDVLFKASGKEWMETQEIVKL